MIREGEEIRKEKIAKTYVDLVLNRNWIHHNENELIFHFVHIIGRSFQLVEVKVLVFLMDQYDA